VEPQTWDPRHGAPKVGFRLLPTLAGPITIGRRGLIRVGLRRVHDRRAREHLGGAIAFGVQEDQQHDDGVGHGDQ
jgi:hypothetical protein